MTPARAGFRKPLARDLLLHRIATSHRDFASRPGPIPAGGQAYAAEQDTLDARTAQELAQELDRGQLDIGLAPRGREFLGGAREVDRAAQPDLVDRGRASRLFDLAGLE